MGTGLDFHCKSCGVVCDTSPVDGSGAICPTCCEDHIYEYVPGEREHRCKFCDQPTPFDWYDDF
jgi:hypothetical protein